MSYPALYRLYLVLLRAAKQTAKRVRGRGPLVAGAAVVAAASLLPLGATSPGGLARPAGRTGVGHVVGARGAAASSNPAYWMVGADGGVFGYGGAAYLGSPAGTTLNRPVVGMAGTPGSAGYWLVASDGGIFNYGDAKFFGSTGNIHLNQPIVGMASTREGAGYWLVASDGGIFSYGGARFFGSTGNIHLNQPIVGMAPTPDGRGYWLVARDGGIFSFGDATFFGSTGNIHLNQPIVGMASTPDGGGYWMAASDGGLFNYGDAPFRGSAANHALAAPIVGITAAQGRDPYVGGQTGYDISWPQCGRTLPGPPHDVSIIGINDGRPYTANPCLSDQVAWSSTGRRSVYMNMEAPVGIAPADPRISAGGAGPCAATDTSCQAYNWGFNAAEYSLSIAANSGATTGLWWLDIETANTWANDTSANARTIQGAIDALQGAGQEVGIYSTYYQFPRIAGGYSPGLPIWIAGAPSSNPTSYCTDPTRTFGGGQPWMVQYQTDGTYDLDAAC
ncbi:MAG: hypothetical protein ACRD0I_05755 [Acidimicrobiales bacterium]